MQKNELFNMRREYSQRPLSIEEMSADPFIQFGKWFEQAADTEQAEPNAMILATAGNDLMPSARVVLLKKFSDEGFVFFTNYLSRKGGQLEDNPKASLLFFWPGSMRQVRIEGVAEKIPDKESDEYFYSRPIESRATAALSKQSKVMENRELFEREVRKVAEKADKITRPSHWGGYVVKPLSFEFWQGGTNRFHDRFLYSVNNGSWGIARLYP